MVNILLILHHHHLYDASRIHTRQENHRPPAVLSKPEPTSELYTVMRSYLSLDTFSQVTKKRRLTPMCSLPFPWPFPKPRSQQ